MGGLVGGWVSEWVSGWLGRLVMSKLVRVTGWSGRYKVYKNIISEIAVPVPDPGQNRSLSR